MNEFTILDAGACSLFAAAWLGPFIISALRRKVRLIHPNCCIPIPIVWLTFMPFFFRLQGDVMLPTSRLYSLDEWYLAGPMIFMCFMAVCYHAGVWLGGLSPFCASSDATLKIISLPSFRYTSVFGIVFATGIALCLSISARAYVLVWSGIPEGTWIFQTFSRCYLFLPLFVLPTSSMWGIIFVMIVFGEALLFPSKVIFFYISFIMLLFFQEHLLRFSKGLTALVVAGIILTPVAVGLYRQSYAGDTTGVNLLLSGESIETADWNDTLETLRLREYAFESFAIVFQRYLTGNELRYGKETAIELSQFVPHFLWPDKPAFYNHFAEQFLPFELSAFGGDCPGITTYFLTVFLLDWGFTGCAMFMIGLGLLYGYIYRRARDKSLKTGESWPIILYMPLAFMGHPFIEAGLAYTGTTLIGMVTGLVVTVLLIKIFEIERYSLRQASHQL